MLTPAARVNSGSPKSVWTPTNEDATIAAVGRGNGEAGAMSR
jgi:hypothetical protein